RAFQALFFLISLISVERPANVTLMRTSVEENIKIGRKIAEKLNMAKGPTVLMLPLNGISALDRPGQIFYGVAENTALFNELRANVNREVVEIQELHMHINDQAFAEAAAEKLISLLARKE
ncbi:MAG: Tm-1-like ATP-binding domain-containing protein, partial [Bacillota bacterium]|nr:Tm-1-like ATP-binding domain-containing protein [Bacillota bacterium]